MPIPLAYFGVVLIWSTTPLAIAWSVDAAGFVFGISSRMVLGTFLALVFATLMGAKMVWHRKAMLAYLYGGLGIYGSMMCVYWSAQFIPSGWVSLLFGLTPIFSAIMASIWLEGELLTRYRLAGMLCGFAGLLFIFGSSLSLNETAFFAVCGILLSGMIHSASAVWIKRVHAQIPALTMTAGSLLISAPLFVITWLLTTDGLSATIATVSTAPTYAVTSILYLALFGSVLGFSLYYYVLKHVEATRVALISLLTPVTSLMLGHFLNNEVITTSIYVGSALIISGLAVFELGGKSLPKWVPFRPN
ncbi:MAG: DMT family transporter [Ghiorsea sp.]